MLVRLPTALAFFTLLVSVAASAENQGLFPGEVYKLTAKCSGKVLAVQGASTLEFANVHQWTDDGGPAQQWRLEAVADGYRLISICAGKALQVHEASMVDGGNVNQATFSGVAHQVWRIVDAGDGWFKLVNKASGKCLDVSGAGTANGVNVQQWVDNSTAAQRWRFDIVSAAVAIRSVVTPGNYRLIAKHSGMALDVSGASTADGANVQQWNDNGTNAQRWAISVLDPGTYQLRCKASSKVLEIAGASLANGGNAQQWTSAGGDHQKWSFQHRGGNWFSLTAFHSNKRLDVSGVSLASGANVHQWQATTGANQLWKLTPAYEIDFAPGDSRFVVALGDIVHVTSRVTGTSSVYEACGLAQIPNFAVSNGDKFALKTDVAGHYTYAIHDANGADVAEIEVLVVQVNLADQLIACQYGYTRRVVLNVVPDSAPILFASSDPSVLSVGSATYTPGHATLLTTPIKPGAAEILAVIPGPAGNCVISRRSIDGFYLSTTANKSVSLVGETSDGGPVVTAKLTMTPLIAGLELQLKAFVSGITFENSTTSLQVFSSQFTPSGVNGFYDYVMLRTPTGTANFCHTTIAYQGVEQVSR